MIIITGASDDLIEIDGDIQEEFSVPLEVEDGDVYLAFSDGTLINVDYDNNGIWRFHKVIGGSAQFAKIEGDAQADTFNRVTLSGEILWVVMGTQHALPMRRELAK